MAGFNRNGGMGGGFGGMNLAGMLANRRPAQRPGATYNGRAVAPITEAPPQIEDPPLPPVAPPAPEKKKLSWAQQTSRNIKWAAKNGGNSPMLPFAALLGIPMQQRRGGQWMTIDPGRRSIYPMGTTPYYGPGADGYGGGDGGGGDDTPTDPNAPPPLPADKYPKNMIPEWWKEWYRTQGQYGGVPPVDGLL